MQDTKHLRAAYESLPDGKLISLSRNPKELTAEAQDILKEELSRRELFEAVHKMEREQEIAVLFESEDGISEFIALRISEGYTQQEISMELKERGTNMFEIQQAIGDREEAVYTYYAQNAEAITNNPFADTAVKDAYQLSDAELAEIKKRAIRRGKTNIVVGLVLLGFGSITFVAGLFIGRLSGYLLAVVATGIGLIVRGNRLKRVS